MTLNIKSLTFLEMSCRSFAIYIASDPMLFSRSTFGNKKCVNPLNNTNELIHTTCISRVAFCYLDCAAAAYVKTMLLTANLDMQKIYFVHSGAHVIRNLMVKSFLTTTSA